MKTGSYLTIPPQWKNKETHMGNRKEHLNDQLVILGSERFKQMHVSGTYRSPELTPHCKHCKCCSVSLLKTCKTQLWDYCNLYTFFFLPTYRWEKSGCVDELYVFSWDHLPPTPQKRHIGFGKCRQKADCGT